MVYKTYSKYIKVSNTRDNNATLGLIKQLTLFMNSVWYALFEVRPKLAVL